ncbi:hypothetical protein ACOSP7_003916 [Xanthoceras sorbifolium]
MVILRCCLIHEVREENIQETDTCGGVRFLGEEATEGHQLTSVEIVFSFTQLILTYIDLVMKILHVKTNYNTYKASVFPLVLAIIVLFFAFKTNEEDEEEEVSDQPDVNDPETLHNTQRSPQQRVEIINTCQEASVFCNVTHIKKLLHLRVMKRQRLPLKVILPDLWMMMVTEIAQEARFKRQIWRLQLKVILRDIWMIMVASRRLQKIHEGNSACM